MTVQFGKASKKQSRLRLALIGPSGSGKTYTALRLASGLGGKVAVLDTERGSASKYADEFAFDVSEMESFDPRAYVEAINTASAAGYDVLVIDSLSHAWTGKDGALEQVDKAAARSKSGNSFAAWREVTPMHNEMVDAILRAKCHVIVTMRTKTEWVLETNDKGKQVPRKVGLQPIQRDGLEYEFDVVGDMDDAKLCVTKTRCKALHGAVMKEPGADLAGILKAWLTDGAQLPEPQREPKPNVMEKVRRDALTARAAKLWGQCSQIGMTRDGFPKWVESVLGAPKPSKDWAEEDLDLLESAAQAEAAGRQNGAADSVPA